jgi:hypothetical protein
MNPLLQEVEPVYSEDESEDDAEEDKDDQLSCVYSDDASQGLPSDIEWGNEFEEDLGMYSYF